MLYPSMLQEDAYVCICAWAIKLVSTGSVLAAYVFKYVTDCDFVFLFLKSMLEIVICHTWPLYPSDQGFNRCEFSGRHDFQVQNLDVIAQKSGSRQYKKAQASDYFESNYRITHVWAMASICAEPWKAEKWIQRQRVRWSSCRGGSNPHTHQLGVLRVM